MMRTLGLLTALSLVLTSVTSATEYVVKPDGTGDFPTIQAAIDAAADGDVIKLKKGTYRGDGNRDVAFLGKAITMRGIPGNPGKVVIDPEGSAEDPHRAFRFWDDETLDTIVEGITFTGGYSPMAGFYVVGGALSFNGGSATVRKCVFVENDGVFGGGAVSMVFASPVFIDCVFERNRALTAEEGGGGALAILFSAPSFERCEFIDNWSANCCGAFAGGIAPYFDDWTVITLIDCVFDGNRADNSFGGAVGYGLGILVEATRCAFTNNSTSDVGGAVAAFSNDEGTGRPTTLALTDCTLAGNVADGVGGAIYEEEGGESFFVDGCTFAGNVATDGGAVWLDNPSAVASIENSILAFSPTSEAIAGLGGAIVELSCSDVYGNAGGDYVGLIAGLEGMDGNISADPLFCEPSDLDFTLEEGSPCLPEETGCGLMGAHPEGCDDPEDDDDDRLVNPSLDHPVVQLGPARPNPFTGSTQVTYTLLEAQEITLVVYDVRGRKVATLVQGVQPAGDHAVEWTGLDDSGRDVEPGVYFTRLDAGAVVQSRGLVLTR